MWLDHLLSREYAWAGAQSRVAFAKANASRWRSTTIATFQIFDLTGAKAYKHTPFRGRSRWTLQQLSESFNCKRRLELVSCFLILLSACRRWQWARVQKNSVHAIVHWKLHKIKAYINALAGVKSRVAFAKANASRWRNTTMATFQIFNLTGAVWLMQDKLLLNRKNDIT